MSEILVEPPTSDWLVMTLGQLCQAGGGNIQTGPFGSQLHASDYVYSGVPSVMPQNIGDNFISEDGIARITAEDASRLSRYLLSEGDIVYSRRGDVERRALVREEQAGWLCGTGCLRVRLGTAADPRFMSYYLGHPDIRKWIVRHAIGATMPNLNTGILSDVPVTLPPTSIQETIGGLLGALDDKIAVNDKIARASMTLAQARYDEAARARSWYSIPMGQSARWLSGGTPDTTEPSYWGGVIPWISALSLKSPWIADSDRKVTRLGVAHGTRTVPAGVIIFVVRGSSLDSEFRIGLTQREVAFGQDCKALIAVDDIDPAVLFLAIRSRSSDILNLVDHAGHGAGRLATDLITGVSVRLPDPLLDVAICGHLKNLVDLGARCQSENRSLLEIRDMLLPRLMSGEIRVRDAERIVEDAT